MASHGIPVPLVYDEHRDIALYIHSLVYGRTSYDALHAKFHSNENTFWKVMTASDVTHLGNTISPCNRTDDPFSCTYEDIFDVEELHFLSLESHDPLHNKPIDEDNFSTVARNLDSSIPRSISNENSSGPYQLTNECKVDNSISGVDVMVSFRQTSNMKSFLLPFLWLDEHHSIKIMAQWMQESELMNRYEDSDDVQSCEHALICKLSHTLQSNDQQFKPSLPHKASKRNHKFLNLQLEEPMSVLDYAEANHVREVDVIKQIKTESVANGKPRGELSRNEVDNISDSISKELTCVSKDSFSEVKLSKSSDDGDGAGYANAVKILPDKVTGTSQCANQRNAIDPLVSVDAGHVCQQDKFLKMCHVNMPANTKATDAAVHLSSIRGCPRVFDCGSSGRIMETEVSSHLKNVEKKTETTDQFKRYEVSSMATSVTIDELENDKFPGILNINQLHERGRMNYELIIQECDQCSIAYDKQDTSPSSHFIDNNQTLGSDSSVDSMEILQATGEKAIGVQQDWTHVNHKLSIFKNTGTCHVAENSQTSDNPLFVTSDTPVCQSSIIEKCTDVNGVYIAKGGSVENNMRSPVSTLGIAIPSSRIISSDYLLTTSPSLVSPVVVKCKESVLQPGRLTSTNALNSTGMSKNKATFEQRREKELDDILHVLQATVQKMEEDCDSGQSNTWRACAQSANIMDSRSDCLSLTSDAMCEDDLPPLPPPPPLEDLSSLNSSSSSLQIKSSPPTNTITSPTYKASANFSVWTPGGAASKDGQYVRNDSKATTSTPTGFRSVSRPVLKKSDRSPASSTISTSYHLPGNVLPEPSGNVKVTPKHELPHGAVYETRTVDGDMVHTDTYYPAPGESTVLERTKKTTVIKAEHHHGMGPTSDSGVPTALRSTVDNPKAWYKNMFKQIHKLDQEDEQQLSEIAEVKPETHHTPVMSSVPYKPKKLGRITDYTPSEPYVVENKPNGDRIPPSSTSFKPSSHQYKAAETAKSKEEPVHGTEYAVKDYALADHVVMEPKHVVTMHPSKPKETKQPESKRLTAQAKFDFTAQSSKQLGFKKGQIVIITKEINKDWYEGETADRKSTGIFPVAYVQVLSQTERKSHKRGAATAKFDFNGTNPKQLSIKKGDSIQLLEKVDKNWYKAAIGQRTGIVPSNYVEVISEPDNTGSKPVTQVKVTSPVAKDASSKTSHQTPVPTSPNGERDDKAKMSRAAFLAHQVVNSGTQLSKPRTSHGEFDIPELSDEALGVKKEVSKQVPSNTVEPSPSKVPDDITDSGVENGQLPVEVEKLNLADDIFPSAVPDNDIIDDFTVLREKYVAVYQYVPQNEDELELLQGDSVLVVEKCDDGWYVGTCERTGAFGTFPGNYVSSA